MLDLYRMEEGKSIEADMRKCLAKITGNLINIEQHEPGRIEKVKEKLLSLLNENHLTGNIDKTGLNRNSSTILRNMISTKKGKAQATHIIFHRKH